MALRWLTGKSARWDFLYRRKRITLCPLHRITFSYRIFALATFGSVVNSMNVRDVGATCANCRFDAPFACWCWWTTRTSHSRIIICSLRRTLRNVMIISLECKGWGLDRRSRTCYGCCSVIKEGEICLQCPKCMKYFCQTCDAFVHDNIFHCPGCLAREWRVCLIYFFCVHFSSKWMFGSNIYIYIYEK